jgi:hypothetical protein
LAVEVDWSVREETEVVRAVAVKKVQRYADIMDVNAGNIVRVFYNSVSLSGEIYTEKYTTG